jgi:serine/threonine-protein kinase HipA
MLCLHHAAGTSVPGHGRSVSADQKCARNDPLGQFIYRDMYPQDPQAVEIDPVELKLSKRTYETLLLNGVFGALRDAGPDYWGRRVNERHVGKVQLDELDYLLETPDDRAGALASGLTPSRLPRS